MYENHRLLRTKFLPLFVQRRWRKVGITFGRLMKFSRCGSCKRKIPPTQRSDGFCRVNRRQNESGVLRGGKFFRGLFLTEVVGLTVITNHFLWQCQNEHGHILWRDSDYSTKSVGFTRKIPLYVKIVKRILKNLLKWSRKSTTHLVTLGKIRYVNQNKTHLPFVLNPSTASCNKMLLVHSRRRLQ